MKRILLFLATNLAIMLLLGIVLNLLGINSILDAQGSDLDLGKLLVLSAVVGFTGSLFSLAISKWSAKRMMGVRVISQPANATESWLVGAVQRQAQAAGIGMPEVGVFDSPEPNAFATGARRDAALVAVSTGLLQSMSQQEAEAVLAHEVSHVANGDMVTLTLIQGVVNTFVFFFSRIIGHFVDRVIFKTEEGHGPAFIITSIIAQLVLGLFAMMIVMWFSRQREFRADAGGAHLAGRQAMIGALERLQQRHSGALPDKMAAFGIAGGPKPGGFKRLFMSHPPLEERIAALRNSVG
ncbi:MAG: protease HtpX [Burkholderiaceae bacterium]|jgi:heat shock protein HtpX|nr:protease HtpX [Burkholderiaceae bacterium]